MTNTEKLTPSHAANPNIDNQPINNSEHETSVAGPVTAPVHTGSGNIFFGRDNEKFAGFAKPLWALVGIAVVLTIFVIVVVGYRPWRPPSAAQTTPDTVTSSSTISGTIIGNVHTGSGEQTSSGDIIIGDTSTSAEKRAADARAQVTEELQDNFRNLVTKIFELSALVPAPFQDVRKANETESQFQERAKNDFRTYQDSVSASLNRLQFTTARYESFQRALSHFEDIERQIEDTYQWQQEVRTAFRRFESGLQHLTTLSLTDLERTEQARSLHVEMVVTSKIALFNAASYFCQITAKGDETQQMWNALLSDDLSVEGSSVDWNNLQEEWRRAFLDDLSVEGPLASSCDEQAIRLATLYTEKKAAILAVRYTDAITSTQRAINRQITDPYLVWQRKMLGYPLTLTEAEVAALQNAELDTNEQDPEKLFELAAFSFLDWDGAAAWFYFQRAMETGQLSPLQHQFAELSIDRIENPDTYQDSIGIYVGKLTAEGNFAQAGIRVGDVIIAINGETIVEPLAVATALVQPPNTPVLVTLVREGELHIIEVQGAASAGALLSQLIILQSVQL